MGKLYYNYVFFNSVESKLTYNPNGYYTICAKDLENTKGIECINVPLSHLPLLLRLVYNVHISKRANRIFRIPFQNIWYPFIFKNKFTDKKPICFVILERLPIPFLQYLKNRYPKSKFVALYRDLRKFTEAAYPDHPDNPIFDFQLTIDEIEAGQYGYVHFNEFESKIDVPISGNYPESDVFFAGKAKDRLPRLLEAYNIFTQAGLKCKYYLTDVPLSERIPLEGVEYADKFMTYREMLYHTVNSRCVLEINQKDAVGYTSRFLEAVMFNKRLITDNKDVKKSKFYNPKNILCVETMNDIDPEFVKNQEVVDYNYKDEFSPIHLIEQIDALLTQRV